MTGFDGNLIFDVLNKPHASERFASPFSKPCTTRRTFKPLKGLEQLEPRCFCSVFNGVERLNDLNSPRFTM